MGGGHRKCYSWYANPPTKKEKNKKTKKKNKQKKQKSKKEDPLIL